MTRLLIHETAFRAVEQDLAAYGDTLTPLVMDDAGHVSLNGERQSAGASRPRVAWLSGSLFLSPAARAFTTELLASPDLDWVQSAAAGFDHPMFGRIAAKGARLSASHVYAPPIADYVLAGVLDQFQGGARRRRDQADAVWRRARFREVEGSRWLIVGFGAIGQGVAARARACGATIVAARRRAEPHPMADAVAPIGDLAPSLAAADVVVLCAPLNAQTRHLAGQAFFDAMNEGALLVNVGRGALVDEAALLAALERGKPAHAILDVFEAEPLPSDNPFWGHPRVTVTAHTSGETAGVDARNRDLFLGNLGLWLAGRPPLNLVEAVDLIAER